MHCEADVLLGLCFPITTGGDLWSLHSRTYSVKYLGSSESFLALHVSYRRQKSDLEGELRSSILTGDSSSLSCLG